MWSSLTAVANPPLSRTLKGSARAVGATKLAELCDQAEQLVGDNRRMGARDVAVQNIEFAIGQVHAEIQRWEHAQSLKELRDN
ncbi:MAG: Hpt domain-containing protein [Pseudomonadota bacterium]